MNEDSRDDWTDDQVRRYFLTSLFIAACALLGTGLIGGFLLGLASRG